MSYFECRMVKNGEVCHGAAPSKKRKVPENRVLLLAHVPKANEPVRARKGHEQSGLLTPPFQVPCHLGSEGRA